MILKPFFDTEGPLGFPMKDRAAIALDRVLQSHPRDRAYQYRRASLARGLAALDPGERSDTSWITEESPDHWQEVVLASGMDDSHFQLNPIVTLQHAYHLPPVGKSLWRRPATEDGLRGIKAKTFYPQRPEGWTEEVWPADYAFTLVQADLLRGKSIGFLPVKMHPPTRDEIARRPGLAQVSMIIDEWILLEYACCFLPMQPNCVVEQVSKAIPHLPASIAEALALPQTRPRAMAFTAFDEIEKAIQRRVHALDLPDIIRNAFADACARALGRV